jgi:hypothetical protein
MRAVCYIVHWYEGSPLSVGTKLTLYRSHERLFRCPFMGYICSSDVNKQIHATGMLQPDQPSGFLSHEKSIKRPLGLLRYSRHMSLESLSSQDDILPAIPGTFRSYPLGTNHLLGWHWFCVSIQWYNCHMDYGDDQPARVLDVVHIRNNNLLASGYTGSCCGCTHIHYPVRRDHSLTNVACKADGRHGYLSDWRKVRC